MPKWMQKTCMHRDRWRYLTSLRYLADQHTQWYLHARLPASHARLSVDRAFAVVDGVTMPLKVSISCCSPHLLPRIRHHEWNLLALPCRVTRSLSCVASRDSRCRFPTHTWMLRGREGSCLL